MVVKLGTLVVAMDGLDSLVYEKTETGPKERKLPFNVRLKLSKMKEFFSTELAEYEKSRVELVKKHGETDKEGNNVSVPPGKYEFFIADLDKLLKTELDIPGEWPRLTESEFDSIAEVDIDITEAQIVGVSRLFLPETRK